MIGNDHRAISLAAATFRGAPILELARLAELGGFDRIGVRLSSWDPNLRVGLTPGLAAARHRIEELGLAVLDVEQARLRADSRAADSEYLLEGAAQLGAGHLLTFAEDADHGRLAVNLCELGELGRPYGVRPVVEFMPFTGIRNLQEAQRVIAAAGPPTPALLIDTLHLARSGAQPAALDTVDRQLLPFVHLADAPAAPPTTLDGLRHEATYERLLPGEGELPLEEYLRRLPPVPLALEVPGVDGDPEQRAKRAATLTRALLARVEQQGGEPIAD